MGYGLGKWLPKADLVTQIERMSAVNDKVCPLCQQPNGCQAGDPGCWCNFETVPQGLISLVPAGLVRKACICRTCVLAYKKDPTGFEAKVAAASLGD
jgi:hypothetical protein